MTPAKLAIADHLPDAIRRLRCGGLVAFPTETVYGLGADATAPEAVARIFATKSRPNFNPLIAHVANLDQARAEARFTPDALLLARAFWPGPLTLVLPRLETGSVCDLACAGLASIGLRIPSHPLAFELLEHLGRPVAAPSANRSGRLSPTTAGDVAADLGDEVDLILDGGPCPIGLESTIVACREDETALLRPGGIARETIEACLGRRISNAGSAIVAPGMLNSHYAPSAFLRLDAVEVQPNEIGLDFAGQLGGAAALDLSRTGNLTEAAANLFRHLRSLDARGVGRIAVAPVPDTGLGAAIGDRLRRGAAPR